MAKKKKDSGCVCSGNWRLIVREYEGMMGRWFRDIEKGEDCVFFGLIWAEDDYYYGLWYPKSRTLRQISCVMSLFCGGELIPIPIPEKYKKQ